MQEFDLTFFLDHPADKPLQFAHVDLMQILLMLKHWFWPVKAMMVEQNYNWNMLFNINFSCEEYA